ncbi:MAG: Bro-N domain-containing protein [Nanoarchaeota archaeon]|nr:Bro-N domain-containing protein [Nanoarchaeota archaeon]MBU1643932.1 Bro-N domain-containing protein [Nanoarchaeota archaeon]MBU1976948.1 Bro-N domain-containing protein [Nanoarchaeota archaeon]
MVEESKKGLIVFQDKKVRRLWLDNEWFYSVVDIVQVLTDSPTPRQYWGKVKDREFIQLELSPIWVQLKMPAEDGKLRYTDCVNTKNAFRLIQSILSKKAEPFKQWLAQLAKERIEEIENPEIAQDRVKEYYELKGYPKEWIDKRLRGIAIRQDLTEEWKNRGIEEESDFAILTNEISKATFGKTVGEYKQFKGLKKSNQNLRDHLTDWELIFTMLGEKATTDITRTRDAQGFNESKQAAKRGGQIAQNARRELEQETGELVVSKENYLYLTEQKKKKKQIEEKK